MSGAVKNGINVVVCTVQGDIHDIGKNILVKVLQDYDYNVVDLGVNVPIGALGDKVQELGVDRCVVCLSGLMSPSYDVMKEDIIKLHERFNGAARIVTGKQIGRAHV